MVRFSLGPRLPLPRVGDVGGSRAGATAKIAHSRMRDEQEVTWMGWVVSITRL